MEFKVCTACKAHKPLEDYANHTANMKDGKRSRCKECTKLANKIYYQHIKTSGKWEERGYYKYKPKNCMWIAEEIAEIQ